MNKLNLKLNEDLREIEDLVLQIRYFSDSSFNPDYSANMIKNLSKQLLKLLKIEHSDMEHLFRQEKKWRHEPFIFKKKLSQLHNILNKKDFYFIKQEIKEIALACYNPYSPAYHKKIESSCSRILKLLKSEHHNLDIVKKILNINLRELTSI